MKITHKISIVTACFVLLLMAGCTLNQQQQPFGDNVQKFDTISAEARIPVINIGQTPYFPLHDLLHTVGYRSSPGDSKQQLLIGDLDPAFKITEGIKRALKEEQEMELSDAPVMQGDRLLVPVTALSDLFAQDFHYRLEGDEIVVLAKSDSSISMDGMDANMSTMSTTSFFADAGQDDNRGFVALANVNADKLIATAKRYMGTPYLFGAKPYPQSRKFDCSSFTQYVYGKYGVTLPRVARNQAQKGKPVSRQALRKGDLVFFAVPGRFKSDKTMGHVGIYIGNGQMINTYSDKKGVHIANINKGYWADQYLSARRVIS